MVAAIILSVAKEPETQRVDIAWPRSHHCKWKGQDPSLKHPRTLTSCSVFQGCAPIGNLKQKSSSMMALIGLLESGTSFQLDTWEAVYKHNSAEVK